MKKVILSIFLVIVIQIAHAQTSLDSLKLVLPVGQKNLSESGKYNATNTRYYLLTHANEIIIYDLKSCREVNRISFQDYYRNQFESIKLDFFEINTAESRLIVSGTLNDYSNTLLLFDLTKNKVLREIRNGQNVIRDIKHKYETKDNSSRPNYFLCFYDHKVQIIEDSNGQIIREVRFKKGKFETLCICDSSILVLTKNKSNLIVESIDIFESKRSEIYKFVNKDNLRTDIKPILLKNNKLVFFTKDNGIIKIQVDKKSTIQKKSSSCSLKYALNDDFEMNESKNRYTALIDSCGVVDLYDLNSFQILYSFKLNLSPSFDVLYFSFSEDLFILLHENIKYLFSFKSGIFQKFDSADDNCESCDYLISISDINNSHIMVNANLDNPFEGGAISNFDNKANNKINESKNCINNINSVNYNEIDNSLSYKVENFMLDTTIKIAEVRLKDLIRTEKNGFVPIDISETFSREHNSDLYFKSSDGIFEYYMTYGNTEIEKLFIRNTDNLKDTIVDFIGGINQSIYFSEDKLFFAKFNRDHCEIFSLVDNKNKYQINLDFIEGYIENPDNFIISINWKYKFIIVSEMNNSYNKSRVYILYFEKQIKQFEIDKRPYFETEMIYFPEKESLVFIDGDQHLNIYDLEKKVNRCPIDFSNKICFDFFLNENILEAVIEDMLIRFDIKNLRFEHYNISSLKFKNESNISVNKSTLKILIENKLWGNDAYALPNFDSRVYSSESHEELYATEGVAVYLSDRDFLITVCNDKGINFGNVSNGKKLFTWYEFINNNWFVQLPNSPYYMCSKDASKMLHYVTPSLKVIGFDQLDPVYNRPDIVLDSIGKYFGNEDRGMIEEYKKAWEKRIERLGLDKDKLASGEIAVPNAEISNADQILYDNSDGKVVVHVKANDPKYNLRRYNVLVNEVPVYGSQGISIAELNTKQWERTDTIALSLGNNKIQVSVMNELGLENFKYPTYVNYTPKNEIESTTYYIGIGVNDFNDASRKLNYCVKDVQDLAQAFALNQSKVDTLVFTNSEVTKENILALKSYLQKNTTVNDKVIISCSSHGLLDDSLNFYLATYDVDFAHPEIRGLAYEDLEGLLDGIPARNKLLLLDACNSGENERTFIDKNRGNEIAMNEQKRGEELEVANQEINSFQKMNELFVNVRNNTGSVVISAAGGLQSALEAIEVDGKEIENGAFTFSVLECLNSKQDLKVNDLKLFVEKRVEEITKGKQKPTSRQETMEVDWVVRKF